jgi:hypothetical protein
VLAPQLLRNLQYAGVLVDAVQIVAGEASWLLCSDRSQHPLLVPGAGYLQGQKSSLGPSHGRLLPVPELNSSWLKSGHGLTNEETLASQLTILCACSELHDPRGPDRGAGSAGGRAAASLRAIGLGQSTD